MAESKFLDSARLALAHALLLIFGKALLRFFSIVDSVRFLDSEKLDSSLREILYFLESPRLACPLGLVWIAWGYYCKQQN